MACGLLAAAAAGAEVPADAIGASVERAARARLASQAAAAGWVKPQFDVAPVRSARPLAPCAVAPAIEAADTRMPTRMRFTVACPGAGGWRQDLVVRATVSAKVAVMALDVAAGKALAAADMTIERRDITNLGDVVNDAAAVAGMAARRPLRSGELLRHAQLAAVPLVVRGQAVSLVARRELVEVTMAGEALDAGARDATVRVRNANGIVIRARVTGAGMVEPVDGQPAIQSSK